MPVRYVKFITRQMVQAHPESRFVFGDNVARQGYGGQAASMRGEPNAIGVATKRRPSMDPDAFFEPENADDTFALFRDLEKVQQAIDEGRDVVVPLDGLGTGLSELPQRAPTLYWLLVGFFHDLPGEPCPWEL